MWSTTTVGMIAGSAVILVALVIALRKNDFPRNGLGYLLVGAFLIVGSQWNSVKVSTSGVELLKLKVQIEQTAKATKEITTQAQQAAKAVTVTQAQVANLSALLEQRQVLSPQAMRSIREELTAAPAPNFSPNVHTVTGFDTSGRREPYAAKH